MLWVSLTNISMPIFEFKILRFVIWSYCWSRQRNIQHPNDVYLYAIL